MSTRIKPLDRHIKIRSTLRIFCFALFVAQADAQTISLSDTLKNAFRVRPVLTGKWDTQNSFITGKSIQIQSLKVGMELGKTLTLGMGYHWINSKNFQDYVLDGFKDSSPIRMRYVSVFGEYVFYEKKNWVGVIPVQIGMGSSYLSKNKEKIFKDRVVLYEPSISVEYKWSPWIAVGAGYGYRIMLKNNHQIDQNFYAPIYVMRVRILFDELYARFIEPIREGSH